MWHAFGLNLKGFFTHFVVVSSRFIVDFAYFIAVSSHLFIIVFRFIIVLTHLFACKRHFLGHYAFLKFLNALFVRFCALFVILSLCKKVKNPQRLKENLPFLDTSLTLSMTKRVFGMTEQIGMINLGCRLNFLEQMKNLKNLKNLQIFLKIFC